MTKRREPLNKFFWFIIGMVSFVYLLNLLFGIVEIIPDNISIFGNIDEVFFTILLLKSLSVFGFKKAGEWIGEMKGK